MSSLTNESGNHLFSGCSSSHHFGWSILAGKHPNLKLCLFLRLIRIYQNLINSQSIKRPSIFGARSWLPLLYQKGSVLPLPFRNRLVMRTPGDRAVFPNLFGPWTPYLFYVDPFPIDHNTSHGPQY